MTATANLSFLPRIPDGARSAAVLLSGGMDSTTLAHYLRSQGVKELHCLSVNYGQRHEVEVLYATFQARVVQAVQHRVVDLRSLGNLLGGSALTSPKVAVPEGHYAAESMRSTVVPNRNMIMLSIAAGYASTRKLDLVGYAAHAGDHFIYPDCRPPFVDALRTTLEYAMEGFHVPRLVAPFLNLTKAQIVTVGDSLGIRWDRTWSCYNGRERHCGKCGTCVERREAFAVAGVKDPTPYANGSDITIPAAEELTPPQVGK